MAIQVSYPGVYIEEYTPAAPIEGVSTSIAAFIGIAASGPMNTPTLVTSLDAFTETFGGSQDDPTPFYLPPAVEGFFRNGGTTAFITRVGTAVAASAALITRDGSNTRLARVVAIKDGPAGEGGTVTVTDTSSLGTALTGAGAGTTVPVHRFATANTGATLDATRRVVTLATAADADEFAPGDRVVLVKGGTTSPAVSVASTDPGVVRLASAVPAGNAFQGASLRTAPLDMTGTVLRFDVPAAVSLQAHVKPGSTVRISDGPHTNWRTVAEVGADSVTLDQPLADPFDIANTTLATAEFDLGITDPATNVTRNYPGLSVRPAHPRWWVSIVQDPYARIELEPAVAVTGDPRPTTSTAVPRPPASVTGATADNPAASWGKVASDITSHLRLLEPIDEISIVAVPGLTDITAQRAVIEHCERMFDRFAILDAAPGIDLVTVKAQRSSLTGNQDKGFAALYYPWITVQDPARGGIVVPQPPSGHVAGIYAKTDNSQGVHKAPANVGIAGAVSLERRLTDADQGFINLDGVNALRILPGRGIPVVWGARTTANDRNWQYINIRRLFLYLEESIQEGIAGAVFQPNDRPLWQKLNRTITEFLTRTWRDGALFGATAKEAFFVRIDETLNPPSTRKLGRLTIEIGVQPVYPAEFIVVRIGIWDGGTEVSES
ncbi:MAG TPA: phage tail sheath subtilisin-like domain-containing protein [Streptosporangiaceae bacterium]|nr:phage tail sheath subtilisin-like domain-containing protein [Streptosporangiaceae bacterium]